VPVAWAARRALQLAPRFLRDWCGRLPLGGRSVTKLQELAVGPPDLLSAYLARRRLFTSAEIRRLLPDAGLPAWVPGVAPCCLDYLSRCCASLRPAEAVSLAELSLYMLNQLLRDSDCMGMANSLEIRVPFLDTAFVEAVWSAEDDVRSRADGPKGVFVKALSGVLHPGIGKARKQGFTFPFQDWMRSDLRADVEAVLLSGVLSEAVGLDAVAVESIWKGFLSRPEGTRWAGPWALYAIGRYVMDNGLTVSAI
jgi:asparagine synthase (glutamine-hydrolysing)